MWCVPWFRKGPWQLCSCSQSLTPSTRSTELFPLPIPPSSAAFLGLFAASWWLSLASALWQVPQWEDDHELHRVPCPSSAPSLPEWYWAPPPTIQPLFLTLSRMTSHWTSLQTSSQETLPLPGLAISITVPFYDDSFRCHAEAPRLVQLIVATGGEEKKKLHHHKDPIPFYSWVTADFFLQHITLGFFNENLNFYFINVELYRSRLSVTVDGRKSFRIAVREALLSKKAFMAFALMGVIGNETYQIQVLK